MTDEQKAGARKLLYKRGSISGHCSIVMESIGGIFNLLELDRCYSRNGFEVGMEADQTK